MSGACLYTGIKQLLAFDGPDGPRCGALMGDAGVIEKAAILVEGARITVVGRQEDVEAHPLARGAARVQVNGVVLPGFCDSHTHPVFAGPRLKDFELRTGGTSYTDIKAAGGGIAASAAGVRDASGYELEKLLLARLDKFAACGTTAVEAKSGYGLSAELELKSLKAISVAARKTELDIVPTFLAAHAVPPGYSGDAAGYARHIVDELLPVVAKEKLAVFADVFCERGYFSPKVTVSVLQACRLAGLLPKVHAEQLGHSGGAAAAHELRAISADHLDYAGDADIKLLIESGTIATLLPASNYFLGLGRYPDARRMINAGLPVALATDFNPGTSPCWNMQFVLSLACVNMGMSPAEAVCAATVNGAWAMGLGGRAGIIAEGRQADFAAFKVDDYREIPYYFGDNLCSLTVKKGRVVFSDS